MLKRFLTALQEILFKLGSLALLALIAAQIISSNPDFQQSVVADYLREYWPDAISSEQEDLVEGEPEVEEVFLREATEQQNLSLELKDSRYAKQVIVEINDQQRIDFSEGVVNLKLSPQDKVVLNASQLDSGTWIKVNNQFIWLEAERKELKNSLNY